MNDAEVRITRLEERYTHLQKHVTEQDRVILDLNEQVKCLRKELARVRTETTGGAAPGTDLPVDERPPHY